MIAYLSGTILQLGERACLLLTEGGVGYEVFLPARILASLAGEGHEARFFTQQVVREDALELYGFATAEERLVFQTLIGVSKLGPKKALALLSRFAPAELRRVVAERDLTSLTSVSGIGKKTGQQILLELSFKLDNARAGAWTGESGDAGAPPAGGAFQDALAGLKHLGYGEDEAARALREIFDEDETLDVAEAMRLALKRFARSRA